MFPEEGVVVKYSVQGTRASGDMNTSSGNCFTMVGMIHAYCVSHGLKYRLANNGDDCVLIIEKEDLPRTQNLVNWFAGMGFTMESEGSVSEFEHIKFCQTQPVWTPSGYVMVRDPSVAIPKDTRTRCDLRHREIFEAWSTAVSMGGEALAGNIPIFNQFY